ncbi:MAG: type II secretion system protein [Candidatus Aminicenantales bacterium]
MSDFFRWRRGFTLAEMMVTVTILAILAGAAIPIAKTAIQREKEIELRRTLRLIREAIDGYKRLADEKKIEEDMDGYPPNLEILVNGVKIKETNRDGKSSEKIIRFLRRIPRDPITNSLDWGLRSSQDSPDSQTWGGQNVFDIYTKSRALALDGTKYRDW